jgi:hypothetical protein
VRSTVDWENEEAFLAQAPADLKAKLGLWNATFTIPFHIFRYRVRQIAELNHSRVEGAVCADWDEIPEGALVLPVDDDDWFAPDAATVLEGEFDPSVTGYYWTSSWIEVPTNLGHRFYLIRRRLLPWTPQKWICTTNNYAMVKGPSAKTLLTSHIRASRWFDGEVKGPDAGGVKRIDRRLSVANRTLASSTTLRPGRPDISPSKLRRKFRRYKTLYDQPSPLDLAWCRPYLRMMAELMDELEIRNRR